jgi:hypothetical protein
MDHRARGPPDDLVDVESADLPEHAFRERGGTTYWAIDGRILTIGIEEQRRADHVFLAELGDERHIVARAESYACGELAFAAFVPRPEGYWLVSPSGCFVGLDAQLARTDPLDLKEHLRRRGSRGMGWDEHRHFWLLQWVRYGLLVVLAMAFMLAWLTKKRSWDRAPVLARPLLLSSLLYTATAAWALAQIVDLLR